ncbi:MAG: DUF3108 domain-containing protein [Actinomycetota bacterium]
MGRKILAGVLAFVVLVVVGFLAYGWWTRRNPVAFSKGGAFGGISPSGAETSPSGVETAPTMTTATPSPGKTSTRTTAPALSPSGLVRVVPPKAGAYGYRAQGDERVKFGPFSACGWKLEEIRLVVKQDAGGTVEDWTYSSNRQERQIYSYRPDGAYLTFTGSAVTCMGVVQNSEEDYVPPALRLKSPMKVGDSWSTSSQAGKRTETATVRVIGTETVTVPAGTFFTYKMELRSTFSGEQTGGTEIDFWYSPSIGLPVKEAQRTNAQSSGATYNSDYVMQLVSVP